MQHHHTKPMPCVTDGVLTGTRLAYLDQGELLALQAAAVTKWQTDNPAPSLGDAPAQQAYQAKQQAVRDAVAPVYGIPAGCVDLAIPEHDADADDVRLDGDTLVVDVGAKAKRERDAKDKQAEANKARDVAQSITEIKNRRQTLLAETDPIANRDTRQNAALTSTQIAALVTKGKAITAAQRKELEAYTQLLRDMGELKGWPAAVVDTDWPVKPGWLAAMVKRAQA